MKDVAACNGLANECLFFYLPSKHNKRCAAAGVPITVNAAATSGWTRLRFQAAVAVVTMIFSFRGFDSTLCGATGLFELV